MADGERMEILVRLAQIDEKLDKALEQNADHECRVRKLEGRGGRLWDILIGAIITGAMAAVLKLVSN